MSREVRRVPLDYKHPTTYNEHWRVQTMPNPFTGEQRVLPKLHDRTERFVGLRKDYPAAVVGWERQLADVKAHQGFDWNFHLEYNLTGYAHGDDTPQVYPFYPSDAAEDADEGITVRDEEHLEELLLARIERQKPDPADFMPVFELPEDKLGWCLYTTVTDGDPVTPVFATADELIEHLCTVGEDAAEEPYRREAAEALVGRGWSIGTSFQIGDGEVLDGARDADRWPVS